jgi:hypothetical protein
MELTIGHYKYRIIIISSSWNIKLALITSVGFEVLKAMGVKSTVSWM